VIQEEIQRTKKSTESHDAESFGKPVTHVKHSVEDETIDDHKRIKELDREILDLKIANRGKDHFIEMIKKERSDYIEHLKTANRTVGQLETRLHQFENPQIEA
jgi:hypothetical protein